MSQQSITPFQFIRQAMADYVGSLPPSQALAVQTMADECLRQIHDALRVGAAASALVTEHGLGEELAAKLAPVDNAAQHQQAPAEPTPRPRRKRR